jgi:antirestriction protein ArdC
MLEKGVAPWQKPWDSTGVAMPFNPTSERTYRGGNAIHLMAAGLRAGYDDPRWLTYKQAAEQGWQVRRWRKGHSNRVLGREEPIPRWEGSRFR